MGACMAGSQACTANARAPHAEAAGVQNQSHEHPTHLSLSLNGLPEHATRVLVTSNAWHANASALLNRWRSDLFPRMAK